MTAEFIEMIYSFSMLPVINRPTRVQGNSVTNRQLEAITGKKFWLILIHKMLLLSFIIATRRVIINVFQLSRLKLHKRTERSG